MRGLGNQNALADRLDAVGDWVRESTPPMTPLQRAEGLQRVMGQMGKTGVTGVTGVSRGRSAARPSRWMIASFMGLAVASAVLVFLSRPGGHGWRLDGALAYRVEGGEIGDGGYIRSFDSSGPSLLFSEGTELHLMSGARGRLTSVDRRGARLAIEEGEAEVKVTPRPGARWLVDAGPFLITVKGTVFTAAWDGATERLDIRMKHGLVSVTGPLADGVLAVSAGQHLSVDVRKKEVLLRQLDPAESGSAPEVDGRPDPEVTPSVAPAASEPGSVGAPPSMRTATSRANRGASTGATRRATGLGTGRWAAALAAGDLDLILREAEQRGLRRSLARSSREDLAALSDAARYRRRDDLAHRGLLAERERFPRSGRASDSAFLLGRLAEAKPGGEARAIEWYDVYLKEAPSGAYSSEALGRKMVATKRLRGISPARDLAAEYVQRFPTGTYAGAARALLDGP